MSNLVCYHHSNCSDRPAVSTCSKCGKGLCTECTDLLRSKKTGKILCVDCLNAELRGMENKAENVIARRKKELIWMLVGGIIGIILAFALGASLGPIAWFIPFVCASFLTIWRASFGSYGLIVGLIFFIVCMIISPIMLLVRVIKRLKESKDLKQYVAYLERAKKANTEYFKLARAMKSKTNNFELEQIKAERNRLQEQLKQQQTMAAVGAGSNNSALSEQAMKEIEAIKAALLAQDAKFKEQEKINAENDARAEKMGAELMETMGGLEDLGGAVDKMSGKKAHKKAEKEAA